MSNSPVERLEALFALIVDQARSNPELLRRMLDLAGIPVKFVGDEAVLAVDPIIEAGKGYEGFREVFLSFELKDLKKIIKEHDLAESSELKGKLRPAVIDLMWAVADRRRRDMRPKP